MKAIALLILVTAYNLSFVTAAVNKRFASEAIMFPADLPEDVPDPCKHLTYCTIKPKDYPTAKFNKMFQGKKVIAQPALVQRMTFGNRNGADEDGCESHVSYDPLYKVRESVDSPWRTVVQAPDVEYVQRVRLETCKTPDSTCFNVYTPLPALVTYCKQETVKWSVVVQKGDDTEKIIAELPVCCSCHYKAKPKK